MDGFMIFDGPLKSHLQTKYTENFAYQVLKLCFPEKYRDLIMDDAPDLQMPDKTEGIEVTVAVSPQTAQIDGEFNNYRVGKQDVKSKERCKQIIERNGGKIEEFGLSYPVMTLQDEQEIFRATIQNKMKKLDAYRRKGFSQVCLFILYDEMPIPPGDVQRDWLQCFNDAQEGYEDKYDFLYFCYPEALFTYDFSKGNYKVDVIDRELYGALSIEARLKYLHPFCLHKIALVIEKCENLMYNIVALY